MPHAPLAAIRCRSLGLSLAGMAACGGVTSRNDAATIQAGEAGGPAAGTLDGNPDIPTSLGPLVPLITGHLSTFAYSPLDPSLPMLETCENPRTEVGEPLVVDRRSGVVYATFCGANPFLIVGSGDQLTAFELSEGRTARSYEYIHSPVAEGESWPSGTGDLYTWRPVPASLTTPGGTFASCWERDGTDRLFYCRGAGLVRAIDSVRNYQLDLIEKNF